MGAKRIVKWMAWAGASACLLVLLAYLALLFVNRRDEPPSAAVVRFEALSRNLAPVPEQDNGFIYFMGFAVPPPSDPMDVGLQHWKARLPQARAHDFEESRSAHIKGLLAKCKDGGLACARLLEESDTAVAAWLDSEQWLARRYRSVLAFPQWREPHDRGARLDYPFWALMQGQKNLLLNAWRRAGEGDVGSVRQLLDEDVRFWRRNLAESDILISKMIAVAAIERHFAWSNMILRRLPADKAFAAIPAAWQATLSDTERSMLRPFAGEWRLATSQMNVLFDTTPFPATEAGRMGELVALLAKPTLQRQATSNRHAGALGALADALAVSYDKLPRVLREQRLHARKGPAWGYNLFGHLVLDADATDWKKYAARVNDLEGIRRATLLAAQLRGQRVPAHSAREQVKASALRDPYDGRSFLWSDAEQAIVFVGLTDGERGRTSVAY